MQPQRWLAGSKADDLDIAPADGDDIPIGSSADALNPRAERLGRRLLGGETCGQGSDPAVGVRQFLGCKDAPEESIPPARDSLFDPVDVDDIDAVVNDVLAHERTTWPA